MQRVRSFSSSVGPRSTVAASPELSALLARCSRRIQELTLSSLAQHEQNLKQCCKLLREAPPHSRFRDVFRLDGGFAMLGLTIKGLADLGSHLKESDARSLVSATATQTIITLFEAVTDHPHNRSLLVSSTSTYNWRHYAKYLSLLCTYYDFNESTSKSEANFLRSLTPCLVGLSVADTFAFTIQAASQGAPDSKQSSLTSPTSPKSPINMLSMQEKSMTFDDSIFSQKKKAGTLTTIASPTSPSSKRFDKNIKNAEFLDILFEVWSSVRGSSNMSKETREGFSNAVLNAVDTMETSSLLNLLALRTTSILTSLLRALAEPQDFDQEEKPIIEMARRLLEYGVTCLEDSFYLVRAAIRSSAAAELLLSSLSSSSTVPFVEFDMAPRGFSSLEVPDLNTNFPPLAPANGYTITCWIRVESFDDSMHTTIFGTFEPTHSCLLLFYIEKDSNYFILQTSVTSTKPSVRFKNFKVEAGQWYHVALVHRHEGGMEPGMASLFINGEFSEQVRCAYPQQFSPAKARSESPARGGPRLQAFFGTPQNLAVTQTRGATSLRWRLASAHLISEALSDELILAYQKLGPRYHGNFQDCLGAFQTYREAAELNLYNETFHSGKEQDSVIAIANRDKASKVLTEDKFLFSFSARNVFDSKFSNTTSGTLNKILSTEAYGAYQQNIKIRRNPFAINGAIPSFNEAILSTRGVAYLTGDPLVVIPRPLDDAFWSLAGFASLCLKMIDSARDKTELLRAVKTTFTCISGSWRNSDAMEKESGYAILASILRRKLGIVDDQTFSAANRKAYAILSVEERNSASIDVLRLVLGFVGFDEEHPEESLLINPLAYRVLLVDQDLWRRMPAETQRLYYMQFGIFAAHCKQHHFNRKRLGRMRVVRRLLDALKTESFAQETFPDFVQAFKTLLEANTSSEVMRSVALFVTYALQDARTLTGPIPLRPRVSSITGSDRGIRRSDSRGSPSGRARLNMQRANGIAMADIGYRILQVYAELLCNDVSSNNIRRFAKTVTTRWTLHLLAESDPRVVSLALKILARLLVLNGSAYTKKFTDSNSGFIILQHRLRSLWHVPAIWTYCFAILMQHDVAKLDINLPLTADNIVSQCLADHTSTTFCWEIVPVMTSMFRSALRYYSQDSGGKSAAANEVTKFADSADIRLGTMELTARDNPADTNAEKARAIVCGCKAFVQLYKLSSTFRDYSYTSTFVQHLLAALYPVLVESEPLTAEAELSSEGHVRFHTLPVQNERLTPRESTDDLKPEKPKSEGGGSGTQTPRSDSASASTPAPPPTTRPRRSSSFVVVAANEKRAGSATAKFDQLMSPTSPSSSSFHINSTVMQSVLNLLTQVLIDNMFERKDFAGFGLFLKVPPGDQDQQAYFESFILRNTMSRISSMVKRDTQLLCEPRRIINTSRSLRHVAEAVFEGWFVEGAESLLELSGTVLELLQRPDIAAVKSVRLCSQATQDIRNVFVRATLLQLSLLNGHEQEKETIGFMHKLLYWQSIILHATDENLDTLRLIYYLLYEKLLSPKHAVRLAVADCWRMMLVQKPDESISVLTADSQGYAEELNVGFMKLLESDNETFLYWIDNHRKQLDALFFGSLSDLWNGFVLEENRRTQQNAKLRVGKRHDKLKQWRTEEANYDSALHKYETATSHWRANIHSSERMKHHRAAQDQHENMAFMTEYYERLERLLFSPVGLETRASEGRWYLDETESRDRKRMRLLPLYKTTEEIEYQPKRAATLKIDTSVDKDGGSEFTATPSSPRYAIPNSTEGLSRTDDMSGQMDGEEEFEVIDDPNDGDNGFEDKNRKVMRSLQRGDRVLFLCNAGRIVGLEACEGLFLLGQNSIYLMDNLFQRSDGEVVSIWQAPLEERDHYLQEIAGREKKTKRGQFRDTEQRTRHWRWEEVLSISKRRFLFRDVGIEIFFLDGRSYLLILRKTSIRNELYNKLVARSPNINGTLNASTAEHGWRLESLRTPDVEIPQSIGARFANVFTSGTGNAATRKWMSGEMSNFHYLMLVNTMAGRTFNDLTQYPVFPWVIADYTSEELDLTNPRSFRDLSKPMGCQHASREADFRERYATFAEMGDHNAPAFHYGTHYSSAMIVCSYLIRLQPYVESYLLLQGGTFDHADRMFYSIKQAWRSASKDNMTDVRELTPEFFYMPEFLTNMNGFNFGVKQGGGDAIDNVELPPWAKGDPQTFIAKHREALESPYVSARLHQWIDLIFGFKQRGEQAIAATNVFHHLSYHGARDLDSIDDPVERLATIGIIHNFGQTPHQVFQKQHPPRGGSGLVPHIDSAVQSLALVPFPILESHERVSSLVHSAKNGKLLCSTMGRISIPPNYESFLEYGFADNGVRFFDATTKKRLNLVEHLHTAQLSMAAFADTRTLVTASYDCTLALWNMSSITREFDLQPRTYLFGHKAPVHIIVTSRTFNAMMSIDAAGEGFLWDLNAGLFVRRVSCGLGAECAAFHNVSGLIAVGVKRRMKIFTLNGHLLIDQEICPQEDDYIASCAFYEGVGNEWVQRSILFTGQRRGIANAWQITTTEDGQWRLQLMKRMDHGETGSGQRPLRPATITCILPMATAVYTGGEDGRVYEWDCMTRTPG